MLEGVVVALAVATLLPDCVIEFVTACVGELFCVPESVGLCDWLPVDCCERVCDREGLVVPEHVSEMLAEDVVDGD